MGFFISIDRISFTLPSDNDIKSGKNVININVTTAIPINNAGQKTFTANGRRFNQKDVSDIENTGKVVDGIFKSGREVIIRSTDDKQPHVDAVKHFIETYLLRRKEHFETSLIGVNELLKDTQDLFVIKERSSF